MKVADQAPADSPVPDGCLLVTCALIRRGHEVLVAKRADSGLWEFPGGKVQPGENLAQCLQREIKEELDIEIEVLRHLDTVDHLKPGPALRLHCFACTIVSGKPKPLEHTELSWASVEQLAGMELCPPDAVLVGRLLAPDRQSL
ncbi:MAG: (deoxy)nucleoside triphosphate pyrophosphohydrolase [Desulfarculaceae bacterium]|jgi:mutator protein MutT